MTPHPLADRIAQLIQQWRERANETSPNGFRKHSERAIHAMRQCAAELEKIQAEALAQGVPPSPAPDYVTALREAQAIVRASVPWKRFIEHTPLENDIAVWMVDFAFDVVRRASALMREAAQAPSGVPPASAPDSEQ